MRHIEFQSLSPCFKYSSRLRASKLTSITGVIRSTQASISGYLSFRPRKPSTQTGSNTRICHIDLLTTTAFLGFFFRLFKIYSIRVSLCEKCKMTACFLIVRDFWLRALSPYVFTSSWRNLTLSYKVSLSQRSNVLMSWCSLLMSWLYPVYHDLLMIMLMGFLIDTILEMIQQGYEFL